jgi:methyl-accepting chemotaxis protein
MTLSGSGWMHSSIHNDINQQERNMHWFNNRKVGVKLAIGFGIATGIAVLIGFLGYQGIGSVKLLQDELYTDSFTMVSELSHVDEMLLTLRGNLLASISAGTPELCAQYVATIDPLSARIDSAMTKFQSDGLDPAETELMARFQEGWGKYAPVVHKAKGYLVEHKEKEAIALIFGEGLQPITTARKSISDLIEHNRQTAAKLDADTDKATEATMVKMLVVLAIGATISIGLGWFIAVAIRKPLQQVIGNIGNADLNSQFNAVRKDEIGDLLRAFDRFVASVKDTLLEVNEAATAVASATTQISSSTEEMAAGSQEQTSQASEVASAVEEMTKTIVENSKNASVTADNAKRTRQAAEEGGRVVEETVAGMNRIADVVNKSADTVRALGKSSDQIGEIVGVIDDIAEQTNLLALNAAIEAARAGDQGRGFAVVADEVRKLAERTSKATKEIAAMIKQIQVDTSGAVESMKEGTTEVATGIQLADKAGSSLRQIVGSIQEVTDMVGQIAAASEQQSSASEQISKNVEAISAVTSQSAQGTQQIAHAAEDLNRLTENLQAVVARFKITSRSGGATGMTLTRSAAPRTHLADVAVRENGAIVSMEQEA